MAEYVVPKEDQTSRPTVGVTSPAQSMNSVMQLHLDSQSSKYQLQQVSFSGNQTVPLFGGYQCKRRG